MLPKANGRTRVLCLMLLSAAGIAWACEGTPPPVCGVTIYLAKFVQRTVVVRRGAAVPIPIGLVPFVAWNTNPRCAQPSHATLTLRLICTPVAGGPSRTFGPLTLHEPTPTVPGAQPIPGVTITLPAGSIPPATLPQLCLVTGSYTVSFGGGAVFVGNGDTHVCLVPPAPGHPTVPRLDMRYLPLDPHPFPRCRRGDQATLFFLVTNNDPAKAVSLDVFSEGNQTARLPAGFTAANAYANNVYAISSPTPGTDTFAARFADELGPCELLPEQDPATPTTNPLDRSLMLPPLGAAIVPIAIRSHGMCADGSCNERFVKVQGTFADHTNALGCAGTALLVDSVSAKSPLCEYSDSIKVNPHRIAVWSAAQFGNEAGPIENSMTFGPGNLPPSAGNGFQLTGTALADPMQVNFPPTASDSLRLIEAPTRIVYAVNVSQPGQAQQNAVQVRDIGNAAIVQLPLFLPQPARSSFFDVFFDVSLDQLAIVDHGSQQLLFQGTLQGFEQNPPTGLTFDPTTCRIFRKSGGLDLPCLSAAPLALCRLFPSRRALMLATDTITVSVKPPNPAARWMATVQGAGVRLASFTGPIDTPIHLRYVLAGTNPAPATNLALVRIFVVGAVNSPLTVPVCARYR